VLVRRLPELRFSMRVPLRVLAALGVSVAASVPLGLPSILRAALGGTVFIGTLAALRGFPPDLTVALRGRRAHSDTPPPSAWP
jgi:hypothetical protein